MNLHEAQFRKRFLLVCGGGGVVLVAPAWALVTSSISPRTFAVIIMLWWAGMFACLWPVIRTYQKQMAEQRKSRIAQALPPESKAECLRKIRSLKRWIVLIVALFPVAVWLSSGKPLPSRIEEVVVWIFVVGLLVHSLVKRQKELKSL